MYLCNMLPHRPLQLRVVNIDMDLKWILEPVCYQSGASLGLNKEAMLENSWKSDQQPGDTSDLIFIKYKEFCSREIIQSSSISHLLAIKIETPG